MNTIEARGLVAQSNAILYSADFPTVIDMAGELKLPLSAVQELTVGQLAAPTPVTPE